MRARTLLPHQRVECRASWLSAGAGDALTTHRPMGTGVARPENAPCLQRARTSASQGQRKESDAEQDERDVVHQGHDTSPLKRDIAPLAKRMPASPGLFDAVRVPAAASSNLADESPRNQRSNLKNVSWFTVIGPFVPPAGPGSAMTVFQTRGRQFPGNGRLTADVQHPLPSISTFQRAAPSHVTSGPSLLSSHENGTCVTESSRTFD